MSLDAWIGPLVGFVAVVALVILWDEWRLRWPR
jgi:hypothetical protein